MYGVQLWGGTKKSNIEIIQTFLRSIVDAPWYEKMMTLIGTRKCLRLLKRLNGFRINVKEDFMNKHLSATTA